MTENWTIASLLKWTVGYFERLGIDSPRVDAELLLSHLLGIKRIDLYLQFERPMSGKELAGFKKMVVRRADRCPVQYITCQQGFRYIDLQVGEGALIPRPETEIIIDIAKTLTADINSPSILDIGTGSGAIALSIASEMPDSDVIAVDISEAALEIARSNLRRLGLSNVKLVQSDLFSNLDEDYQLKIDLIVSNPPYISEASFVDLPPEVRKFEPKNALVPGDTGLEIIDRIVSDSPDWLSNCGNLLVEIAGPDQALAVRKMVANSEGLNFESAQKDLAGIERFVILKKV